ncbi:26S proteasome regulatory subunit N7 [Klebsormidium nitens]|uniref:26S proteasome regulatory subunit RPN7 n=1 Tax=Klebsormidium nitens TaxID=105231 RepID=A0A1Y1IR24_KLENI|nr:26S proteasome regulatory subunit N7 [Klebsormidium nitens]|eukprot:GAQ91206.1 26S proteasome regulatory subunit N7 [Klebsormidium nitens]
MAEEELPQDSKLELAETLFLLSVPDTPDIEKHKYKEEVLAAVEKDGLVDIYEKAVADFGWSVDKEFVKKLRERNAEDEKKIDEKIKDAEENLGESEVREALLEKAMFYIRIGNKEKALAQMNLTEEKTIAVGQKMDLVFHILRLGFFELDFDLVSKSVEKAKILFASGGDWERKNRLKVYEGLYHLATRNFKKAADLFLDSIATFTATELFPYKTFIFYTVLTSLITLKRVDLKAKVVDAPEILAVIGEWPHLSQFLNALYDTQYKEFFSAFAPLTDDVRRDRYLSPHYHYYMREVRVIAYTQFLESYKSVTLDAMAGSFGVSVDFLDSEISHFIASGRLNAKIDKVSGVLETNRPDAKNALYQSTIKQGDLLLNRIQKLSRVIDL